jgi:cellulose biosynthesis protein BcsQ
LTSADYDLGVYKTTTACNLSQSITKEGDHLTGMKEEIGE